MSEVREDAEEKAKRLGLDLVKPKDDEVFVDIDSEAELVEFHKRFAMALKLWIFADYKITPSHKDGHYHAIVTINELAPIKEHERIALQAALGSDPLREMLAIYHGRAGYKWTSVFFEKPITPAEGQPQ